MAQVPSVHILISITPATKATARIIPAKGTFLATNAVLPTPKAKSEERLMNKAERDARANISADVLREMERACPTNVLREIALKDNRAPQGPSSAGIIPTSQPLSNVGRNVAGGGTGWMRELSLRNPPGTNIADKLMDEQDRRDRAELVQRAEAMRRAELARKG
jgi:hypothetical protein